MSGREPHLGDGAIEFAVSFFGGAAFGVVAGRLMLTLVRWTRDNPLAEATLTLALAYLSFIVADRLLHVSGVVATLAAGMTVSALGRRAIDPHNWSFLDGVWAQVAFWAHSLVFLLASILVPKLLIDLQVHDVVLVAALVVAAFAARLAVLFGLLPLLSLARLTKPISTAYKLAIAWGGLRGALTLVLALSVTENPGRAAARSSDSSRCSRPASCSSRCWSTARPCASSSAPSASTGCRRSTRCCATGCWRSPTPTRRALIRETAARARLDPAAAARALAPYEALDEGSRGAPRGRAGSASPSTSASPCRWWRSATRSGRWCCRRSPRGPPRPPSCRR